MRGLTRESALRFQNEFTQHGIQNPQKASRLGFLGRRFGLGFWFCGADAGHFILRRFCGRGGFHGGDKEAGEQSAAQEGVAEKLPGLRPAFRAGNQRRDPAEDGFGVFGILEGIEQPRSGVGDEIKEQGAENAATQQADERGATVEALPEPNDRGVSDVIHQLIFHDGPGPDIETLAHVIEIQRNVGQNHCAEGQPPGHAFGEIDPGAKDQRVRSAEVGREYPRPTAQRKQRHEYKRQRAIPFFFHRPEHTLFCYDLKFLN